MSSPARIIESSISDGVRAGLPFALPTFAIGISFGVLARPVVGAVAAIVMSIVVFSGGAQFASISVLAAGGGVAAAFGAGLLVNARFLVMGIAIGPYLRGRRLMRGAQAQALVDASFAIASRADGSFDRGLILGATIPQAAGWMVGTAVGVLAGPVFGDPKRVGLDAVFVAFYLALLWNEAARPGALRAAAAGAAIALALMPFAPVGVPVIAASLGALVGLGRR